MRQIAPLFSVHGLCFGTIHALMDARRSTSPERFIMPRASKTPQSRTGRANASGRMRRHPAALEERRASERGSSEQPDDARPVDSEAYPQVSPPTSGTLASLGDSDELSVSESGLPVEPEDLGIQFLRDATEQDNFESETSTAERPRGAYALGQMISEATLEASGQEGSELPQSSALAAPTREAMSELDGDELSLAANTVRSASLFDEPTGDYEASGTRAPNIVTDESAALDEHRGPPDVDEDARAEEVARLRAKLRSERSK